MDIIWIYLDGWQFSEYDWHANIMWDFSCTTFNLKHFDLQTVGDMGISSAMTNLGWVMGIKTPNYQLWQWKAGFDPYQTEMNGGISIAMFDLLCDRSGALAFVLEMLY